MSRTNPIRFHALAGCLQGADALVARWPDRLDALKRGDGTAWNEVLALCAPRVDDWLRHAGLQHASADDVRQSVFVAAYQSIDRFAGGFSAFLAWLHEIARRRLRAHLSGERRLVTPCGDLEQLAAHVAQAYEDPVYDNVGSLLREVLEDTRGHFHETTWDAFWAVAVQRQRVRDVSDELGMSVDAIRHGQWRILRCLRKKLESLN